jgi:secreted protein with Ig-like and vWFA domain
MMLLFTGCSLSFIPKPPRFWPDPGPHTPDPRPHPPLNIRFDHPEYLWLLLLAGPIVWLGLRSLAALEPARRWTAIGLRLAVLTVLVLMLAGLQAVQKHSDLTVIAVVDQSESVRRFAKPPQPKPGDAQPDSAQDYQQWARSYLKQTSSGRRGGDRLGLVTYDGRSTVRALPSEAAELDSGTTDRPTEGTDTASAIRSTMALFTPDAGRRMVLVSDGNDTTGDTLAAAREAAAAGIPIDVLPVPYRVEDEVMVERLYAPSEAHEGQTVSLRVVLRATKPAAGLIQLLHDDQPIDLNGEAPGRGAPVARADWTLEERDTPADETEAQDAEALGRYVTVREVDIPLGFTGINKFKAVFEPVKGSDSMQVNNKAEAFTLVSGKGRVLFVDNIGGASGGILPRALASRGIEMDVVTPRGVPVSIGRMQRYDAIILQNVPYDAVTPMQQRLMVKYVHDLGGGLVMLGGPDSFGAGGWTNSDLDRYILPVSCQIPSQTILPSGALMLVIDRSSSMGASVGGSNRSQQELANEAAVLALNTLYPQDLVGVIAFSGDAMSIVKVQMNSDPAAVAKKVHSLQPGGGTNIYAGLDMAYRELAPLTVQDAAVKHIILLTDGNSGEPAPGAYIKLASQMRKNGITLSTIGVGDGHNQQLLSQLANMAQGNYHPITNPANLPQVFIKEAKTIRKNLVKEILFVPTVLPTGSPIMANITGVPPLKGFVLTGQKRDPRVVMPMVGPEGEPLFAHWQVGLGRSAAFTSDATNRWASQWLSWGGYPDFWARTVRRIARPSATRDADLLVAIHDGRLQVQLDAVFDPGAPGGDGSGRGNRGGLGIRGRDGSFGNFLDVRGSILKPDGSTEEITLDQVGPGQYRADTLADQTGNYVVSLFIDGPDGTRRVVFGGAGKPPGQELRRFKSNTALLQQIAAITNGRILDPLAPSSAGLFDRTQSFETRSIRPLWRSLVLWLIVLFMLDVACRRIAWDAAAILAWCRQRIDGLLGSLRPREVQAQATLAALKSRQAQTQRHLDERASGAAATAPDTTVPPPSKKRKFQAASGFVAEADFTQAVGGADAGNPATHSAAGKTDGSDDAGGDGPTTSRLLAARRRARKQLDSDN